MTKKQRILLGQDKKLIAGSGATGTWVQIGLDDFEGASGELNGRTMPNSGGLITYSCPTSKYSLSDNLLVTADLIYYELVKFVGLLSTQTLKFTFTIHTDFFHSWGRAFNFAPRNTTDTQFTYLQIYEEDYVHYNRIDGDYYELARYDLEELPVDSTSIVTTTTNFNLLTDLAAVNNFSIRINAQTPIVVNTSLHNGSPSVPSFTLYDTIVLPHSVGLTNIKIEEFIPD